jgi:hypothetical protein
LQKIDVKALIQIKGAKPYLTRQQFKTLRGQVFAGDSEGAMKGLRKLLLLNGTNAVKRGKA